jgi:DNA-binding NtrC family response regulator
MILCVDDEPNSLVLRKLVLERAGYKVITATSMQQAMKMLENEKPDLVLSDQLMPGGTGTELARQVKERLPEMPVIIISGVNEIPPDATHADLFMSKVEGPVAMCEKVASVLNRGAGDTSS